MKIYLIILFVIGFTALSAYAEDKLTPAMKAFLHEYRKGEFHIDVSKLEKVKYQPTVHAKGAKSPDDCDHYTLPSQKIISDSFRYTITHYKKENKFVVIRSGGFAGLVEAYQRPEKQNK